jgi:hypothetical protein
VKRFSAFVLGGRLFDLRLERGIHLLEAGLGLRQHALEDSYEEAVEPLPLQGGRLRQSPM